MARAWSRWSYVAIAVALACLTLVQLMVEQPAGPLAYAAAVAMAAVAAVALLPARPLVAVTVVAAGVAALFVMLPNPPFATFLATMVVCYGLVRHSTVRVMAIGFGLLVVVVAAAAAWEVSTGADEPFGVVYPIVYFGGAGLVGWLARRRADHLLLVEERAAALERERAARDELAAADERVRLARELHDVVAHGVSLMVVQAEAASEVLATQPERAAETLTSIADTGRHAIADLRTMLDTLRDRAQIPARLQLDELLDRVRRTGLDARLVVTGNAEPLPPGIAQAAQRIVQEALTNTIRHANAHTATVELAYGHREMVVRVSDDGTARTPAAASSGQGLRGMAERAAEYGGDVHAGLGPDGGFTVRARLPYGQPAGGPA